MTDKKQLLDDELEKVSGGKGEEYGKHLPGNQGKTIGEYEAEGYKNTPVYLVRKNDPENFWWGTLIDSYEKPNVICGTTRTQKIYIEGGTPNTLGYNIKEINEIPARRIQLFVKLT